MAAVLLQLAVIRLGGLERVESRLHFNGSGLLNDEQLNREAARAQLRVLILEDKETDTILLLRALRRSNFDPVPRVVASKSGFLDALEDEFDLILADYSLEDMNGADALRILGERGLDIPVIIVTGTVTEEVVVECMRLGAADYLLKDRLARLGEAIKGALRAWELREENRVAERELEAAREQAQRDYLALLDRLAGLAEQVGLAPDARSVYRALFDFCIWSTPADSIFVASFDHETELRTCEYTAGVVSGVYEEHDPAELPKMPLHDSPQGRAIKSAEVVLVRDYRAEVVELGLPVVELGSDVDVNKAKSAVAVPLRVAGRTIGAFELQSTKPAVFDESHITPLAMAANHAAIALENVRLLDREREQRRLAETSERRYRDLVEQASDGIVVFDEDGSVSQMNPMMRGLIGTDSGGDDAYNIRNWLFDRDSNTWTLPFTRLDAGHTVLNERRVRRPHADDLPVETNTRKLADGNYQTIVRDISERKRAAEALLEEKRFSDTVINSLPGVFYVVDEDYRLVRWNNNVNAVTGYSESEIATMSPLDFFSDEQRPLLQDRIRSVVEDGSATALARLRGKDGRETPYFFSSVRLLAGGRTFVMGTGLDVSQQQQAEERERELNLELEKRLARLSALHEIDMAITGSVDLRLTLNVVLDKVVRELEADACSVWVYEEPNQRLDRLASKGFTSDRSGPADARLGDGPVGRCGLERRIVRLAGNQLAREPVAGGESEFSDYLAVPLVSKGKLQGVLEVFGRSELESAGDWLEFLEALALQTAIAIDNVMLFQGLERSASELALAYDATIEGWARALDLRDHETEGHSRRVTEITESLARHMGVAESDLAHIRRGALLHDIGKLGVPDAILAKPAELSDEEREVMKKHARLGYELLYPVTFLRPAIDIPYCHHEKWDGSGYPRGLRGEEIPLPARIFAVADVFDAVTSNRPYRRAWSVARALDYLADGAGEQFDPQVVRAFLELYRREDGDRSSGGATPERE
ncbi:MAG: HD domain-containing phosphohydrolase [Trueperaceae bacterium]